MTTAAPPTALATIQPAFTDAGRFALAGFLAGYRGLTREAYALDLRQFASCCRARRAGKPGWGRNQKASSTCRTRACLLVQARSQHDFAASARRSGLGAARRHLFTATFR
jgi:hypothetical protein